MKYIKYLLTSAVVAVSLPAFTACGNDDDFTDTIFPTAKV